MKIIINENENVKETEITINCRVVNENISKIIASLRSLDQNITGIRNGQTYLLKPWDILYIDTVDRKTFLYGIQEVYETPLRLYELEDNLAAYDFMRATKSSIINFNKIKSLRPDFGNRLVVTMDNNEKLNISRQYVPTFKAKLGVDK